MTGEDILMRAVTHAAKLSASLAGKEDALVLLRSCVEAVKACTRSDAAGIVSIYGTNVLGLEQGGVVPDVIGDPRRDTLAIETDVRYVVFAPIRAGGVTRGALVVGSRTPGSRPWDATLLATVKLFSDLAAQIYAREARDVEERIFHERLAEQAKGSTAAGAASCGSLQELCVLTGASAAAISRLDDDGIYRVYDAWNLADAGTWTESEAEVARLHADGAFSCTTPTFAHDLRVLVDSRAGKMVLHLLGATPFTAHAARHAELAAVRLSWFAHATVLEEERRLARPALSLPPAIALN